MNTQTRDVRPDTKTDSQVAVSEIVAVRGLDIVPTITRRAQV